jgi:hypothetical protein
MKAICNKYVACEAVWQEEEEKKASQSRGGETLERSGSEVSFTNKYFFLTLLFCD